MRVVYITPHGVAVYDTDDGPDAMRQAVMPGIRLMGCTCEPDVRADLEAHTMEVSHDGGCVLLRKVNRHLS